MADRYRASTSRPAAKRQPLIELRNKTNTPAVSQRHSVTTKHVKTDSSNPSLPHNESLEPNGTLAIRSSEVQESPTHKRVSQITNGERESKRNSAISTTSTTASGRRRKTFIGHWQLGKTIGKGGCSRVRVVRHRYRDQYGAVKIITRSVAESTRAQSLANLIESTRGNASLTSSGYKPIPYGLEREIAVMKLLEHPNIVRLYDVWENRNELYLIMEYVDGGELFHYVDERKGLLEDETVYVFRQIVSALLYCHKLRICHRDLKPENILLDQRDLSVKLIDFGMAALQPEGRLLSTPCGSPHYAAPEVVSSKPYDGTQADVWSCGVILYVMLTGTTPYNYGEKNDIRTLFRDISKAKYYMPPDLSLEAKDLIRRIFVADPKRRISMDDVWEHPLLHKFDKRFGLDGEDGSKRAAVGPLPQLNQWKVKRIQDIDREILGNMRTLWHSESEQSLIQKLLNNEYNQEKLFYAALVKHREENLENYVGEPDDMSYSASDYHHSRPPAAADAPPLPSDKAPRTHSQYSIMNDEHLRPSQSFLGPPPSLSSYDPYRASKDPIVDARGEYLNVIVHRNGTTSTRRTNNTDHRLRHPHSTRIETLKQQMSRHSNQSSSSLQRSGRSRPSMPRSSMSRHSMTSSLLPSSPPVIASMRPSDIHKRGVSFSHIRRISTASALTSEQSTKGSTPATPCLPKELRERQKKLQARTKEAHTSSPTAPFDQPVKSRKERGMVLETPRLKVRKSGSTPSQHMRSEIRKHSAELEKACEEAFFRDSFGSGMSAHTSMTDKPSPYDTPPSSVSAAPSATPELPTAKAAPRPLPELPKDTPNSYLTRTLEETRKKLEAYKTNGETNTAKFDEVMKMLENIMPAGSNLQDDRRIRTAPETSKTSDQIGFLPIISEESGDVRSSRDGANWHRNVTDPVAKARTPENKTIRMVQPSSPGTIAPLNVRKRSNGSQASGEDSQKRLNNKASAEGLSTKQTNMDSSVLASIDEDSTLVTPTVVRKKRSGWFGRMKKDIEAEQNSDNAATPSTFARLDDGEERRQCRTLSKTTPNSKPLPADPPDSADSSEFPIRKRRFEGAKKGLSKWIGRMGKDKGADTSMTEGETTMFTNRSLDSLFSSTSPAPSSNDAPPAVGPERSWFARFFNIKPAVQILCFNLPRGRARQELVILLKEWQRHGIRDLQYSRENNTITARVDKHNSLDIKPVIFRIELFVVLEHGRKVGLSIARFVQVKGAVSGLRRVIEVVDGVMRGRGWLVEDEEKWRALCEVVGQ